MWRWRQRREGGGHQPRDGHLEPPEAGRDGEDPPLEPLQGAQPWDPLTSDVWSPGLGEGGCPVCGHFLRPSRETHVGIYNRLRHECNQGHGLEAR